MSTKAFLSLRKVEKKIRKFILFVFRENPSQKLQDDVTSMHSFYSDNFLKKKKHDHSLSRVEVFGITNFFDEMWIYTVISVLLECFSFSCFFKLFRKVCLNDIASSHRMFHIFKHPQKASHPIFQKPHLEQQYRYFQSLLIYFRNSSNLQKSPFSLFKHTIRNNPNER